MSTNPAEGFAQQYNFKLEGDLYNVKIKNHDEAEARKALEVFAAVLPEIMAVRTMINAQGVLKETLNATPIEHRNSPSPVSVTGGKTCKHGEMKLRSGTNDKGTWNGYFCPSPKGTPDQCKTVFVR
jgi:hypothetical protein